MKRKITRMQSYFWFVAAMLLSGCVSGPCHSPSQSPRDEALAKKEALKQGDVQVKDGVKYIKVFKYDGSKQCESGLAMSPEEMAQELEGIEVFKAESVNDGLMRPQFCGNDTGQANVFTILEENKEAALQKGFKLWTFSDSPQ